MPSLVPGLLGPVHITRATGEPVVFPYDKVAALLAYLAVERERVHRRESLAALLWPDQDERAARHSLSQALWSMRRAVANGDDPLPLLLLTRDTVQLDPASDMQSDVAAFEAHVRAVDEHVNEHAVDRLCRGCVNHLEQAVALYRGPFMQTGVQPDCVAFDEWVLLTRERLHQSACRSLDGLIRYYDQRGDASMAITHARKLLELDPWREATHRQLMGLLAATGQRSAALEQYERCRRLLRDELGVEPEQETTAEHLRIRAGTLAPPRLAPKTGSSLPAQTTPFVGREQEARQITALLDDRMARVVTLVGPGGIGKTRLAIRVAEAHRRSFRDGVYFVPLAGVTDTAVLASAIAGAIGATFQRDREPLDQLAAYLRERELLLVLDNFEQLVDDPSGPRTVAQLVEQAFGLTVIVTSRQRLHLHAEWIVEIDGLDLPIHAQTDLAATRRAGAVQLFLTAARRSGRAFVSDSDLPAIVRVCQLVGGMPLGIELAAAWTPVLSVSEIAAEIERSVDFLAADLHDLPDRHRSVRAIFDRSWEMLPEHEQRVFSRLSVFHGGFRREAAEQIAGASLPVLASLTGRSLLRRTPDGRYDLHELVRQYAAARLHDEPSDARAVRDAHGAYYMQYLADQELRLKGLRQARALGEIQQELNNVRAAWGWAVDTHNIGAIAAATHPFWLFVEVTGCYAEGQTILKAAVNLLDSHETTSDGAALARARLMVAWSSHLIRTGTGISSNTDVVALLSEAIDALTRLNAHRDLGLALNLRAPFHHAQQNYAQEQDDLRASIDHLRMVGDRWGLAYSLNDLGMVLYVSGDSDAARELHEQSLAIFREIGDQRGVAFALTNLGTMAREAGALIDARRFHEEALSIRQAIRHHWGIATNAIALGGLARQAGEWDQARRLLLDALRIGNDIQALPCVLSALTEIVTLRYESGEWDTFTTVHALSTVAAHPSCHGELRTRIDGLQRDLAFVTSPIAETTALNAIDDLIREMLSGERIMALA